MAENQPEHTFPLLRSQQHMTGLAAESGKIVRRAASVASTVKTSPQAKAAKAFFALKIGSGHFSPVTSR